MRVAAHRGKLITQSNMKPPPMISDLSASIAPPKSKVSIGIQEYPFLQVNYRRV